MNKNIYILLIFLLMILLIPLFFINKVEFDIAEFITQYYIFFANAILLAIFGFFINTRLQLIEESYSKKDKKKKLKIIIGDIIENLKEGKKINEMVNQWNSSLFLLEEIDIDSFLIQTDFNKYSKFISSIQKSNFESKRKVPEFENSINFLINLKKAIANGIH